MEGEGEGGGEDETEEEDLSALRCTVLLFMKGLKSVDYAGYTVMTVGQSEGSHG